MTIYNDLRAIASDVLREFNQGQIELIQLLPGTGPGYNPGPATEVVTTLAGAVARGVAEKYVRNGLASAAALQVTMHATQGKPSIGNYVRIDGSRFQIKQVLPKPAAGDPVAFVLIAERDA